MKFSISGADLKNSVARISCIVPRKPAIPLLDTIRIQANDDDTILFSATDLENFITVVITGNVSESGVIWVTLNDIKKVLTIKTEVEVKSANGVLTVRNGKKSHQVRCYEENKQWVEPKKMRMKNVLTINDKELVGRLSKIESMRDRYDAKHLILSGFYFDMRDSDEGRIVTSDACRIGISGGIQHIINTEFIASPNFYVIMKSVIAKGDNNLTMAINDKRSWLGVIGKDYILVTKLMLGTFFDYKSFIDVKENVKYTVNSKEVSSISKEYKSVNKGEKEPLIMYGIDDYLGIGISFPDYKTCDVIESAVAEKKPGENGYYACFDPVYLTEACEMFNGKVDFVSDGSWKTPVLITDGTDKAIVLPVNSVHSIEDDPMVGYIRSQIFG